MNIRLVEGSGGQVDKQTAIVTPGFKDGDVRYQCASSEAVSGDIASLIDARVVSGDAEEIYFLRTPSADFAGVLLLGLGDFENFDAEIVRRAAGAAVAELQRNKIAHVIFDDTTGVPVPIEAFIEGILLGQYEFGAFMKEPETKPVHVEDITIRVASMDDAEEIRAGCERTVSICECVNWARDLGNTPPTHMTPQILSREAVEMAEQEGLESVVFDEQALEELGMHAFLGVARGSAEPPRLTILKHHHPDAKITLALVGKGVTFDTGGISLKPGQGMQEMKFDMCGAAAVFGAMRAIARLNPAVNVIGAVPSSDNKTGADAQVPGDIVRAYNGKTIEIHSTDAEGRMLLADTLAYVVEQYTPDAVVDAATLTGACVAALGHYAAGVMTNSEHLEADLELAAEASGERIWPLPLWDDYTKLIKGTHSDLNNTGPRGEAGAITAGAFLKEFVGDTPWAHLDIAGTAWGGKHISYWKPEHASGFGVRLFTQWVLDVANDTQHEGAA